MDLNFERVCALSLPSRIFSAMEEIVVYFSIFKKHHGQIQKLTMMCSVLLKILLGSVSDPEKSSFVIRAISEKITKSVT